MTNPDWRDDAQCAGLPIATFDINTYDKAARNDVARRICQGCPVINECRADVLEHSDHNYAIIVAGVAIPDFGDDRARRTALEAIRDGRFIAPQSPKRRSAPKAQNTHCIECEWPLASNHTPYAECPKGFRVRRMHGLCHVCAKKASRNRPLVHQKCADCDGTLRPSGRAEVDFPGTVVHQGGGLCRRCYFRARRRATKGAA